MTNKKQEQLESWKTDDSDAPLTTNEGLKMAEDEHSLKAGDRGPTLMEDFYFREKMTHFDHERIPERVVHARGTAAHGIFECYEDASDITKADFLSEKGKVTPVFTRISTVAGSRGSADTVRDVRGFATKFYTDEGNYDLVGNNIPVFFMQDAIKFPDFIHAVKPEPHNEIPQAQSAHDTFWDYIASNEESAHMVMWHLSDRAIPRSLRMMEAFGVNTYRFINAKGDAHFVKFHWKPTLGVHSLVWDEAQKIAGKDPDFHRRDLYENIERGNFVEYELGVQLIPEANEFDFDFDVLDPTKLWPEEQVPVRLLGKMTLNENVDNFFAETEQVAFHVGNVVPGIDFSNDPLLQGRLFSYTDTQLIRLGGPNFHELPINRPVCPFHNNMRDGYGRQTINKGPVSYHQNGIQNNHPAPVPEEEGGYAHYEEKVEGRKVRARSESFADHFTQARMFWISLTDIEREHLTKAFSFELGKVERKDVRQRVVEMFSHVCPKLATTVARNVGVEPPTNDKPVETDQTSPAVSQFHDPIFKPDTLKVALLTDGSDVSDIARMLEEAKLTVETVSATQGEHVDETFDTADPVLYDAVVVAHEPTDARMNAQMNAFVTEMYNHYKPINSLHLELPSFASDAGVTTTLQAFIEDVAKHRHWDRPDALG